MNGFGVHSFKWVNAAGDVRYIKYKWTTQQGIKNLTAEETKKVVAEDWGNATTDLYKNIAQGNFPSWELSVQILQPEDLDKFDFDPLDATKDWPEKLIPAIKVGKMTLNRVPENFFEETEQSAFSPADLVPGIEASEDRLLQGGSSAISTRSAIAWAPTSSNCRSIALRRPSAATTKAAR